MAATELVVYFEGEMPTKVSRDKGRGDEIVSKLQLPVKQGTQHNRMMDPLANYSKIKHVFISKNIMPHY